MSSHARLYEELDNLEDQLDNKDAIIDNLRAELNAKKVELDQVNKKLLDGGNYIDRLEGENEQLNDMLDWG